MRTFVSSSSLFLVSLALAAAACGGENGAFSNAADAGGATGANPPLAPDGDGGLVIVPPVVPPPPACDGKLRPTDDKCVIHDAFGVFVSASLGTPQGPGGMATPLKTISAAISAAKARKMRIYVCAEEYPEQLTLQDGVDLFGYFDCNGGVWAPGVKRATVRSPATPAVLAQNLASPTRIESLEVHAPDAPTGGSSIGLFANVSPGLVVANSRISAGKGGDGAEGAAGVAFEQRSTQHNGADSEQPQPVTVATAGKERPGGTSDCRNPDGTAAPATVNGGAGGYGGKSGRYVYLDNNVFKDIPDSVPKAGGPGSAGASPGYPAIGSGGQEGDAGSIGSPGSNGLALGTFTESGYTPSDGSSGTLGTPGAGGGGGAGTKPWGDFNLIEGDVHFGHNGAGGGAGGCGGTPGAVGKGGGASVAVYSIRSPFLIQGSTLVSASGGKGGKGGQGSAGGKGGSSGTFPAPHHGTSQAGNGGNGGPGGLSGSGGGGPSICIVNVEGAVTQQAVTLVPGTGGAGAPANTVRGQTIPASPSGTSVNVYP